MSRAKNAGAADLCTALLTGRELVLRNVAALNDVATSASCSDMGVRLDHGNAGGLTLQAADPISRKRPTKWSRPAGPRCWCWVRCWPASAARSRCLAAARSAASGRPAHQGPAGHGRATILVEHGYIAPCPRSAASGDGRITTDMVTVTGTENFLMAATLAEARPSSRTRRRSRITDLAGDADQMGARIEGHGSSRIRIRSVERLEGCDHAVVADRIEAGTFLCAVAATGGEALLP